MKPAEKPLPQETISEKKFHRRTIVSFALFALTPFAGWKIFNWIKSAPNVDGRPKRLRAALNTNEKIFSKLFNSNRLVKEYPASEVVKHVRVNGMEGLRNKAGMDDWRLNVMRKNGETLQLTLDEIKALPKKEVVFDFKCIEGWSQVTRWAGVSLKTFLDHYGLQAEEQLAYVGLQTPDKGYYVGVDMPSVLHPQTWLC